MSISDNISLTSLPHNFINIKLFICIYFSLVVWSADIMLLYMCFYESRHRRRKRCLCVLYNAQSTKILFSWLFSAAAETFSFMGFPHCPPTPFFLSLIPFSLHLFSHLLLYNLPPHSEQTHILSTHTHTADPVFIYPLTAYLDTTTLNVKTTRTCPHFQSMLIVSYTFVLPRFPLQQWGGLQFSWWSTHHNKPQLCALLLYLSCVYYLISSLF